MRDLLRDGRYALRSLARSPTFTIAALLTIALGVGAATTIYSVVDAVLVQPLPYRDSDRLVRIEENAPHPIPGRPPLKRGLTYQEVLDWRSRTITFRDSVAVASMAQRMARTPNGWVGLWGAATSDNAFSVLDVRPMLGRSIEEGDQRGADVVVLSYDTWRRHFNADPAVVGQTVEFRAGALLPPTPPRLLTVVGVLPSTFSFPLATYDFYTPLAVDPSRNSPRVTTITRLPRDVSFEAALDEANVLGSAMRPPWPDTAPPLTTTRFEVLPLKSIVTAPLRPALRVLLAAVALVLLIVCANVANLLLARGTARQRELAVRVAMGASRARIVRLVALECALLAAGAALLGAGLGAGGVLLVQRLGEIDAPGLFRFTLGPSILPRGQELAINGRVFAIAFGIAAIACVVFGLLPALRLSRVNHLHMLASRGADRSRRAARMRTGLVVAQLSLATVLLVGSMLLTRSFVKLATFDKGYDPSSVVALNLLFPDTYPIAKKAETIEALLARFRQTPNVRSAGFARHGLLIGEELFIGNVVPPGRTLEELRGEHTRVRSVSDGFLTAMGAHFLEGRDLAESDSATAAPVLVLSRGAAQRAFGSNRAVGQVLDWYVGKTPVQMTVAGVVEDLRQESVTDIFPEMFVDYRQLLHLQQGWGDTPQKQNELAIGFLSFALRTTSDPAALMPHVREIVREVDVNIGVDAMVPLERLEAGAVARERFYAVVLSLFAAVAGVLATIGISGLLAYNVSARTQEIGIRMALGAQARQVRALIVWQGIALTVVGLVAGLAIAAFSVRFLESLLFGITPLDPWTFAAVGATVTLVAVAACYLPASRAIRIEPVVALRRE